MHAANAELGRDIKRVVAAGDMARRRAAEATCGHGARTGCYADLDVALVDPLAVAGVDPPMWL